MKNRCRICDNEVIENVYQVKEVRQKTGEIFEFFKCDRCGCVQIISIPHDIGKYYKNYYSFESIIATNKIKSFLRKAVFKYRLFNNNFLGYLISKLNPNMFSWIESYLFDFNSSVLDIGCGNGALLYKMAESGFTNLTGVDPFIKFSKIDIVNDVKINLFKEQFTNLSDKYDIIMLHHVLEHIENQHDFFTNIKRIMHPNSKIIFVLPIISDMLWNIYGIKSFQFEDIPRHLYIHSQKSFEWMIMKYGYKIINKKSLFEEKILNNIYGESEIYEKSSFKKELIMKHDTGLICYYVELN